jgi:hypothetical protein
MISITFNEQKQKLFIKNIRITEYEFYGTGNECGREKS